MSVDDHTCPVCGRAYRAEKDARACHGVPSPRVARYVIGALTAAVAILLLLLAAVG